MPDVNYSELRRKFLTALDNLDFNHKEFIISMVRPLNNIFEFLAAVILSQNTSDKNAIKAFNRLKAACSITPQSVLKTRIEILENAIMPAGLYRVRARTLKKIAKIVMEKYDGNLEFIRKMEWKKARKILLDLPGVGEKTADVVLAFLGKPVFPIDTHIRRIVTRLGLARRDNYEEISSVLKKIFKPEEYLIAHLKMISYGRQICRARRPRCESCSLNSICYYFKSSLNK